MKAYYNEHDPKAAAWLRELIKQGHIAQGDVDERSIEDVLPNELTGYTQCHFFAGIGVWSAALRGAGWPDDRPVWTGSCPCQPFSAAGKRGGTDDERHLWPAFYWLIQQCQPVVIFGEQVASKDGVAWFNDVQSDMEAENYAVGGFDIPAAGFGAPHIRQRLFFVADTANRHGRRGERRTQEGIRPDGEWRRGSSSSGTTGILADTERDGRRSDEQGRRPEGRVTNGWNSKACDRLGDDRMVIARNGNDGHESRWHGADETRSIATAGATNGFWQDAEWLYCTDQKYRPTQPGVFPLAHGVANRVVKLRGCGNAIVKEVAQEFIKAFLEQESDTQ